MTLHDPIIDVSVGGSSITQVVSEHNVSLTVASEAGVITDRFSMTLSNEDGKIQWPGKGAEVSISMGYRSTGLTFVGKYQVDERQKYFAPARIKVRGTSAKWIQNFKSPKERSFHDTTLGAITQQIASENGWQGQIDPDMAGIPVTHIDQKESDAEFVTRLAHRYGAVGKPDPDGDIFLFASRYSPGAPVVAIDFARQGGPRILSGHVRVSERPRFTGYRAYYLDEPTGERKSYTAGGGDNIYEHQAQDTFEDALMAAAVADAQFKIFQHQGDMLHLVMTGDPRLAYGQILRTVNLDEEADNRPWSLHRVVHGYQSGGFQTTLVAHSPPID